MLVIQKQTKNFPTGWHLDVLTIYFFVDDTMTFLEGLKNPSESKKWLSPKIPW
jgi:hypothetical protein